MFAAPQISALSGPEARAIQSGQSAGEAGQASSSAPSTHNEDEAQAAIAKYEKLAKGNAGSAENQFQLGQAYYAAGRPREAVAPLQQALKLKPSLAQARYLLGASLAETGRCEEAISDLKQAAIHATDQHLLRAAGLDGVKCAMELDHEDDAVAFLERLQHQFPRDPEVIYIAVHAFSDLSTRASQRLLMTDPGSYQVHELSAEALEAQGKWDEAAREYRQVLTMHPNLPGIHYRLGRLILSEPKTPTTFADAIVEFKAELEIDPHNAGAEFVLGELALREQDVKTALEHLSNSVRDDPHFVDAQIELGRTLMSTDRPADAIAPLEAAVKLQPDNPGAHYLLSTAYRRVGRQADANRELAAFQEAQKKSQENTQEIRSAVTGRKTPAQTEKPPNQ